MANPRAIGSTLPVLMVSDLARSHEYYRNVLGFNVTDWWVERDGLNGFALKMFQADHVDDVRPNTPAKGAAIGVDVYAYVDTWDQLESLLKEFKGKGADIAQDIVTYPDGGPWKEFIVRDPDGYAFAFGGVDGRPGGRRSPLRPHISGVTLWVRNLDAAAERYAKLLDLNVSPEDRYFGHMHVFHLENGTDLALDSNGMEHIPVPPPAPGPVLFTIHTDDIDAAHDFVIPLGFEIVYGIKHFPGMAFFNMRDEDGNILTIVQSKQ
ncbi:VOC family protein [Paenibacillus eucommiae]|uniref:Enzyme related to lactoylglutathione lyase n=1 Tax=Paenibacillus eucommiae TaxID=1355755 RepID=A0ABS4IP41_9BACL|nr:VOC family protein [Paenibacillus eucommiae]MBP1989325.1 putative enzyme related to lactoylglutathione lyase [Paenibacillus eucommiae]